MRNIFLCILLTTSVLVYASDETPGLVTDRPDQTESSSVVPLKSLQIETGFVMEKTETNSRKEQSFAYNTTLLRYGLLKNFELRLGIEYLGDHINDQALSTQTKISGLSPLYAGFKVNISEEDGLKPELAVMGGLSLPFTAGDDYVSTYTAAGLRFAVSHTLTDRFSLGYNLGVEWDGETAVPAYFYSLALGVGISDNLGVFLESYGLIPEAGGASHMVDAGFTWLVLTNLQLDVSGGLGLNENAFDHFVSCGLSYRIPE